MSVESFWERYPPGDDLYKVIKRKQEQETTNGRPKSKIGILALMILEEGKMGLRNLTTPVNEAGIIARPDAQTLASLPKEQRESINLNQAAIVFGTSVIMLEKTLIEKEFNLEEFCSHYNLAISGTIFEPARLHKNVEPIEKLSEFQWSLMTNLVKKDRTLASFFTAEGIKSLPQKLGSFLQGHPVLLSRIREKILPGYQSQALSLLNCK